MVALAAVLKGEGPQLPWNGQGEARSLVGTSLATLYPNPSVPKESGSHLRETQEKDCCPPSYQALKAEMTLK